MHNRHKNGTLYWELATIAPLKDSDGTVTHFIAVKDEITKRKADEQKLRMLVFSLDHCPDAVIWLSPEGRVLYANKTACDQRGYAPDEMIQLWVWDIDPDVTADSWPELWESIRVEKTKTLQLHHRTRRGDVFPVEISANLLKYNEQEFCCSIVRDLTERRRLEEVERQKMYLQTTLKSMEQVMAVIGHELRTPLSALRLASELLLDEGCGEDEVQQVPLMQIIHDETVRMAEMVNNMLEAARLNSGLAKWQWAVMDLAETLRGLTPMMSSLINSDQVKLEFDAPKSLMLSGDQDAVRRLVINLVTNAAKHTRAGTISVTLAEHYTSEGRWAHITVTDTGEGIPPDIVNKLGQAFVLNRGVVGADFIKGTGLGLSICREIVSAHGGRITVQSRVGEGTTMTVTLPADLDGPVNHDSTCRIEEVAA